MNQLTRKPFAGEKLRKIAGERATEVVANIMAADLVEDIIPFEVEHVDIDDNGSLYADVRLGIVVRVPITMYGGTEAPDEPEEDGNIFLEGDSIHFKGDQSHVRDRNADG